MLKVCGHITKWLLSWRRPFFLNDYNSMVMSFWKIAEFTFPFLSTDCLQWSSIPMMLGSVFLDVAVIWHDRTILRDQCVFS